jgi:hypothetical protein
VVLRGLALVRWTAATTTAAARPSPGDAGAPACSHRHSSALSFRGAVQLLWARAGRGAPRARNAPRAVEVATLALLAVVGPFLLSCALAYGDPLYSVNYHTKFYRSRSGLEFQQAMGCSIPARRLAAARAGRDGAARSHHLPVRNKWRGFEAFGPGSAPRSRCARSWGWCCSRCGRWGGCCWSCW